MCLSVLYAERGSFVSCVMRLVFFLMLGGPLGGRHRGVSAASELYSSVWLCVVCVCVCIVCVCVCVCVCV